MNLTEIVRRCEYYRFQKAGAIADTCRLELRLQWYFACPRSRSCWSRVRLPLMPVVLCLAIAVASAQPTTSPSSTEVQQQLRDKNERPAVILTQEPAPRSPNVSVNGTVTDHSGQPIVGATVVLRANLPGAFYQTGLSHNQDVLARTKTDSEGRYVFSKIGLPLRLVEPINNLREGIRGLQVLTWADGMAMQWGPIRSFDESDIDFELVKETEVVGEIVDESGMPLKEGVVRLHSLTKSTDLVDLMSDALGDIDLTISQARFTTDLQDGQFRVPHIPPDYRCALYVTSTAGHRHMFVVDTGNGTFTKLPARGSSEDTVEIHRSPIRIVAKQQPTFTVRVRDHDGKPVTEGSVVAISTGRSYLGEAPLNDEGTAHVILNSSEPGTVVYHGDPYHPRMSGAVKFDAPPQLDDVVEIQLPKARRLTGKVVDSDTGQPIPGVLISAGIIIDEQTLPYAGFSSAISQNNGNFELPVTDGKYRLSIRYDIEGYLPPQSRFSTAQDIPEPKPLTVTINGNDLEDITIKIGKGLVLSGVISNEGGDPVPNARIVVETTAWNANDKHVATISDENGRYTLSGISPYVSTQIFASSDTGVAEAEIPPTKNHPWNATLNKDLDLTLRPATSVTGRVVKDGKPVPGVRVTLMRAPPRQPDEEGVRFTRIDGAKTDENGTYRLTGLEQDDRFYIQIEPHAGAEIRDWTFTVPYSQTVRVKNGETITATDAVLKTNGQSLAGVVVDPDGNPVEGVTVSASLASGGNLSRPNNGGPPPWTETDAKGHFELTYLPEEPISLKAYKANPEGGRILRLAELTPKMNDKKIRILYDPQLNEPLEDLD